MFAYVKRFMAVSDRVCFDRECTDDLCVGFIISVSPERSVVDMADAR